MRIFSTIIEIAVRSVADIGHHLAMRNTVAAQTVGNGAPRLVLQPLQKPHEEALGRFCVPAILHEDVEHGPVLIDSPPETVQRAVDLDEYLVEVPGVAGLRAPLAERFRGVGIEFLAPAPNTLVGYDHAAVSQDELDVS